jgi:sugar lactone lactonase YvrE
VDEHGNAKQFIHTGTASAIAIDKQGIVYLLLAVNLNFYLVRHYRADGSPINGQMVIKGNNIDSIAVDAAGKLYTLSQGNAKVRIFESNGYELVQSIKTGPTPRAIALTPDGKIYVANFTDVACYLPGGMLDHPVLSHANPEGGFDQPMALTVDGAGQIYVGYYNGFVAVLDKEGKPKGSGFMAATDQIWGIAVR